jgi:TM2 domain-containing membrane protein YozV
MQNTDSPTPAANTTVIVAKTEKSAIAAFFLTFLFGPLGLLYATIGGGIFMIIVAVILVPLTVGLAALVVWPISMIWGVAAALASKSGEKLPS